MALELLFYYMQIKECAMNWLEEILENYQDITKSMISVEETSVSDINERQALFESLKKKIDKTLHLEGPHLNLKNKRIVRERDSIKARLRELTRLSLLDDVWMYEFEELKSEAEHYMKNNKTYFILMAENEFPPRVVDNIKLQYFNARPF